MQNNRATESMDLFRRPAIFKSFPGLISGESTRHGGVSSFPYESLNLGGSTQDDPENVSENNRRFFQGLGVPLNIVAKSHQIHGAAILKVSDPGRFTGYDALITSVPNVQLAVTIADCTPILIFDPVQKAVAAIHAGWRGTVAQIVRQTVEAMQKEFMTAPVDCVAYVGTCIDECSFEVGNEVAENFSSTHKRWDADKGKFFIDLKAANRDQLIMAGVKPENIEISIYSTVLNNEDYFSYRFEKGTTGRMLASIGMKK